MRVDRPHRGIAPGQVPFLSTSQQEDDCYSLAKNYSGPQRCSYVEGGRRVWMQALVLYAGAVCLGTATIDRPGPSLFDLAARASNSATTAAAAPSLPL